MVKFTKSGTEEDREMFSRVRWVLRAVAKDKIKPVFTCLYSDGTKCVCSDSRRLHVVPVAIPAGLYEIVKSTAQEVILSPAGDVGQFPDYKQVIPAGRPDPVKLRAWDAKYTGGARCAFQVAQAGFCMNYFYLEDACKDHGALTLSIGENVSPVVISGDLGTAVIMPIQIKEDDEK